MENISFTHINIKPIVRGRKYVSEFTVTSPIKTEVTIGGNNHEECLAKTEKFLNMTLESKDYTIHK